MTMNNRRTETVKRWTKLAAVPVGVLAAGAMVLGATHATVTASAWNKDNTVRSGTWTKSKVTSDKGDKAVVEVSGLMPGDKGNAGVNYTFAPSKADGGYESRGHVVLRVDKATDADGKVVPAVADSELAKHLHLAFTIDQGKGVAPKVVEKTLAEWWQWGQGEGGRSILLDTKLNRNDPKAPENASKVGLTWSLDPQAPEKAAKSTITFDLGAEIDTVA
ncbi:hypothetical protein ACFXDE_12840 [Kitasatospora sp. NPDC059408]|uniref:hypothetical protein n=1 Tax=Kitasatospora sp. NPDC059408 TaxID=3346823 RepID=UPI0036C0817E